METILKSKSCKLILYACAVRFPGYPSSFFPFYMLVIYLQMKYKNKTFAIRLLPHDLMHKLIAKSGVVSPDPNNTVIINENVLRIANIKTVARLQILGKSKNRFVRVIGAKIHNNELFIANNTFDNAKLNASDRKCKLRPVGVKLKIASYIDISLVNTQHDVINAVTDELLRNYFKTPKLIQKNDLILIEVQQYCPKYYYTHNKVNEIEYVYFKCKRVRFEEDYDCIGSYFCVDGETTLKQSANVQSFLIPTVSVLCANAEDLISMCPLGLERHLQEIEKCIRPFIDRNNLQLKATFLLRGSRGSGKSVIITSLAAKLGLHLYKISAVDLSSQTYAQTEIKIHNVVFKAKLCSPCILFIENFENFGKNNEGQYDQRIIGYFKSELENLFTSSHYPIVLICAANAKDIIPSDLSRLFLEIFDVDAPTQPERSELLKWLLLKQNVNYELNIDDVASKAHGFLFEDLKALVYYARKNSTPCLFLKDFENALDVMQMKYTDSLGAPKVPKVEWSDVGGLGDVKHEIIRTINLPLKHPELLKSTGLKRSGILLYGPPGTGKTLLAKAVATECSLCFLSVKGPELLNMYVGQSEQNVREVFEKARQASPCIIFFDELDALAPNRGISGDSGGVMDRVVSQLLAEMDGLNQTGTLFVIGATNRPDLIDPALLRPGRFDKLLYVGPCVDYESKLGVLGALTRKFKLAKDVNLEEIVKICPKNITGADFYGLCSTAWTLAAKALIQKIEKGEIPNSDLLTHDDVLVAKSSFLEAIKTVKPSVTAEDLMYFDKLKQELSGQSL